VNEQRGRRRTVWQFRSPGDLAPGLVAVIFGDDGVQRGSDWAAVSEVFSPAQ